MSEELEMTMRREIHEQLQTIKHQKTVETALREELATLKHSCDKLMEESTILNSRSDQRRACLEAFVDITLDNAMADAEWRWWRSPWVRRRAVVKMLDLFSATLTRTMKEQ